LAYTPTSGSWTNNDVRWPRPSRPSGPAVFGPDGLVEPHALIGPYRILGPLGAGGMAVVYRAEHVVSRRPAAVKTVQAPSPRRLAGIRREIQALSRIRHPGVVRIIAEGLEAGRPWYAMDLIEGETLRRFLDGRWGNTCGSLPLTNTDTGVPRIAAESELAPGVAPPDLMELMVPSVLDRLPEIARIFSRLCATLAFLHGEGIVNCDLKPENVLLLPGLEPLIIDFGLTSTFGAVDGREVLESARGLEGTAGYMSPERIRNELIDARADLYSVGCMLYEAVTGVVPFTGTEGQILYRHLHESPRAPSELVRDLPPALEALILGLLVKSPDGRVGYAADVSRALAEIAAERVPLPVPASPPPGRYRYRPRFSGRCQFMARVRTYVEDSKEGRGTLVLVGGESGVGKTRFAMEVTQMSRAAQVRVVTGQCLARFSGSGGLVGSAPLHPLRAFLQAVADRCQHGGQEVSGRVLGGRGPILAAYEPALSQVPGEDERAPPASSSSLPAEPTRGQVVSALVETITAFAADRPLLLILDDLQWADDLTLDFLAALTPELLQTTPLLLLGTHRSEELSSKLRLLMRASHLVRLTLDRLDCGSVEARAGACPPAAGAGNDAPVAGPAMRVLGLAAVQER
jgi:serine/threonine protein kinase